MATVADVAAPAVAVEAPAMENDAVLKEAMRLGEGEKNVEEVPKPRKRKPTLHPPYFEMIREAILAQAADGKSGSSTYAIARYMGEKYRDVLPPSYRKMLAVQLRSLAAKGRLVKVKASFKLAAAEAEEKKVAEAVKTARAPAKRKRTANPRKRKPGSAGPHHPPYFEMIKDAILAHAADGGKSAGCSPYLIAKYMGEKHRDVLPASYRKMLAVKLRSFAAKGHLVKVKASFKLAEAEGEEEEVAAAVKKAAPAKRRRTPRAPGAKKPTAAATEAKKPRTKRARKAASAPAPSQPKPVRAGGTKKANKASA